MEIGNMIGKPPVTVGRSTTICDAAAAMERSGEGALLVVEEVDGIERLAGIVTDRDIVVRGVARRVSPDGRIDALMTTEVITAPAGLGIERAYEIFRHHAIRRLPVVDGGRPVGLICVEELLVRSEQEIADLVHPLHDEVFAPRHEAPPPVSAQQAVEAAATAAVMSGMSGSGPGAATGRPGAGGAGGTTGGPARGGPVRPRLTMSARPGDTLVVHGHRSRQRDRHGEIFEVRSVAGGPPFLVRWTDTRQVSFVYPGPDAEVRRHRTS